MFVSGFKEVNTRHWTQDAIENFFGQIRAHGFRDVDPTCLKFGDVFKTLMINNITSSKLRHSNCAEDEGRFSFSWAKPEKSQLDKKLLNDLSFIPSSAHRTAPFPEKGKVQCDFQSFSKAALKRIKCLRRCPLCSTLIKINEKTRSCVLKRTFAEIKEMIKKLLPRIFSLCNIVERITSIIVKEFSPQHFSCSHHGEMVLREIIKLIAQQYIDAVISFLNKVM